VHGRESRAPEPQERVPVVAAFGAWICVRAETQRVVAPYGAEMRDVGRVAEVDRIPAGLLERIDMPDAARTAIAQARRFDAAVAAAYPGFFASRRNYDIARGIDANGRAHAGVLEQSWRIGGASGAEIAALKIFKACPGDRVVHASTWETYGPDPVVPAGACVCYHGVDARAGELTKYYRVQAHGGQ